MSRTATCYEQPQTIYHGRVAGVYKGKGAARPSYDSLSLGKDSPYKSAWNLYGSKDEKGTLNLLDAGQVLRAQAVIRSGKVFPLALPLGVPQVPMNPLRLPPDHKIFCKGHANDDQVTLNTQSSTHWDGLRHYPYQKSRLFYNGTTQAEIGGENDQGRLGVQNLAESPIVTTGVLLDYARWAKAHQMEINPFTAQRVSLEDLLAVCRFQDTTVEKGDILLVRFGWTEQYLKLSIHEQRQLGQRKGEARAHIGVKASDDVARWIWDTGFAAVAADTTAFEAQPFSTFGEGSEQVSLHEVLLSGWGMPIGELFNLESLAEECSKIRRYRFFFSSAPMNLNKGVASPPSALAIL